MKKMAITAFKAHALKVINEIAKTQEHIIITKRGEPVVEIIPFKNTEQKLLPGKLSNTLVFEGDIVSPFGEESWEVLR